MSPIPIIKPDAGSFEPEHRGLYGTDPAAHIGVIVQGSVFPPNGTFKGAAGDEFAVYEVHLLVGPFWRHVQSVVPSVTVNGFYSSNPDQDDFMRWHVDHLRWDTEGELGSSQDELRIRLKFHLGVQGEHAEITRIGYYLMASGRRLGVDGLGVPGPIHPQG